MDLPRFENARTVRAVCRIVTERSRKECRFRANQDEL
jgi:hypothetical protein